VQTIVAIFGVVAVFGITCPLIWLFVSEFRRPKYTPPFVPSLPSEHYERGYKAGYEFGRASQRKEDEAALIYFSAAKDILNGRGPYLHDWPRL
jgi:hypothetical protein